MKVAMFKAIARNDSEALNKLANEFFVTDRPLSALRCTYHLLKKDMDIRKHSLEEMNRHLMILRIFGFSLRCLLRTTPQEIAQTPEVRRLLAYTIIEETAGHEVIIRGSSPLHQLFSNLTEDQPPFHSIRRGQRDEHVVLFTELPEAVCFLLNGDLRRCLEHHDGKSRSAHAFKSLCMANLTERCRYGDGCGFFHVPPDALKQSFNERFRLYLCQILVINDMYGAFNYDRRTHIRR
jgi:hypothetical protein